MRVKNLMSGCRFGTMALAALFIAACGGGEKSGGEAMGGGEQMAGGGASSLASVVDTTTAATITGAVRFEGTAPEMPTIDMSEEPTCAQKHSTPPKSQQVVVNANNTLEWVFVYVKSGQTQDGRSLSDIQFPTPTDSVEIDQDGCQYHPHVLGIQVGQPLAIVNSDGILHNINANPDQGRGFNVSQPIKMTSSKTFVQPDVMVPIRCDVHGWMHAWAGVLTHPYYSVTDDQGNFTISKLPPGTYTVEAWHEKYGTMTQEVTVVANESKQIVFTFKAPSA